MIDIYILYIVIYVLFRIKINVLFSNISRKKRKEKKDWLAKNRCFKLTLSTANHCANGTRQWKFTLKILSFPEGRDSKHVAQRSIISRASIDSKKKYLSNNFQIQIIFILSFWETRACFRVHRDTIRRAAKFFSWFLSSVKITAINRYRWIDLRTERER